VIPSDPSAVDQYHFFLQDYTTQYIPPNGQMVIKLWIGTSLATINADYWGADWRTTAWLMAGIQYQIWVRGVDAPLRLVGPIDAVTPTEEKTIVIQIILPDYTSILQNIYWSVWRVSDSTIRVAYQDNWDNTIEASVKIYDMENNLVPGGEFQPDNEWFIVTWAGANKNESYNVRLAVTHGKYGDFVIAISIGIFGKPSGFGSGMGSPFPDMPIPFMAIASVIAICAMALLFDAPRAHLAVIAMALTTAFLWYMGWLPLPGGWYTVVLILVMAILFALVWGRRRS